MRTGLSKKMVNRWAKRYLEIRTKENPLAARRWAASFLNPADYPLVADEIAEIKGNT